MVENGPNVNTCEQWSVHILKEVLARKQSLSLSTRGLARQIDVAPSLLSETLTGKRALSRPLPRKFRRWLNSALAIGSAHHPNTVTGYSWLSVPRSCPQKRCATTRKSQNRMSCGARNETLQTSHWSKAGVPLRSVQMCAGHSDPQTTLRYAQAIGADEALAMVNQLTSLY